MSLMLGGCGGEAGAVAVSAGASASPASSPAPATAATRTDWRPLRVGAGGFLTGMDVANDGSKVVRCDTFGAYIWSETASEWKSLLTATSMPAGEWGHQIIDVQGVYEIAIAPSDSSRIYVAFNGFVFKSVNRGVTFTKTGMAKFVADPNDPFRTFGRKMAIDPVNPDIVYLGTQAAGLFVTRDGGATWTKHADIAAAATAAGIIVAFDPSSGAAGGKTQGIYVSSQGNGVYASDDAGASFALIAGSPTAHRHMICDKGGNVWLTDASVPTDNLKKYAKGVWSGFAISTSQNWHSIAVNPANGNHIVVGNDGGGIAQSFDQGNKWTDPYYPHYPEGAGGRIAIDIPWLAWTNESYLSNGDMHFDPSAPNKLYLAEGIGVWWTFPPLAFIAFNWTSQSRGIEQLVSNQIIVPPGGSPLYFAWDRPVFKLDNPDVYPATHGPNRDRSILMGWAGDYAVDDSRFVVGLMNWWGAQDSGYSTDGGSSWTKFASVPAEIAAGKIGGSIAVSTSDNIVWVPNNQGNPYYTRDRGKSWTQITLPGVPTTGETGWGWAYYLNRHIVTADKVTPGTFYMYNYLAGCIGLYRSTDGGIGWTRVYSREIAAASSYNAQLQAVPGKAGHLFFTSGSQSGVNPAPNIFLMRSSDGGASWSAVDNVLEVYAFGFGKAAQGQDYPAIFIAGYVKGVWGLWRSDDNATTWINIGDYPLGSFDTIKTLTGDMSIYGRAYLGFGGSGGAYAELVTA